MTGLLQKITGRAKRFGFIDKNRNAFAAIIIFRKISRDAIIVEHIDEMHARLVLGRGELQHRAGAPARKNTAKMRLNIFFIRIKIARRSGGGLQLIFFPVEIELTELVVEINCWKLLQE